MIGLKWIKYAIFGVQDGIAIVLVVYYELFLKNASFNFLPQQQNPNIQQSRSRALTLGAYAFFYYSMHTRGCTPSSPVYQVPKMYEVGICNMDTTCGVMMIDEVTDWITWLVCNLQTRQQISKKSSKFKNYWINHLLLCRQTLESFKITACL